MHFIFYNYLFEYNCFCKCILKLSLNCWVVFSTEVFVTDYYYWAIETYSQADSGLAILAGVRTDESQGRKWSRYRRGGPFRVRGRASLRGARGGRARAWSSFRRLSRRYDSARRRSIAGHFTTTVTRRRRTSARIRPGAFLLDATTDDDTSAAAASGVHMHTAVRRRAVAKGYSRHGAFHTWNANRSPAPAPVFPDTQILSVPASPTQQAFSFSHRRTASVTRRPQSHYIQTVYCSDVWPPAGIGWITVRIPERPTRTFVKITQRCRISPRKLVITNKKYLI